MELILKGMITSAALIVAIGAQNAFVLKQGLLKQNIFIVSSICFICDLLLMSMGVLGVGVLISQSILLANLLALFGSAFLIWYGAKSLYNAFKSTKSIEIDNTKPVINSRKSVIATTLAVTLLNPHVYLDTIVIIGGIAGTLTLVDKLYFLIGAFFSSFIWFFGLGYGSRLLIPLFKIRLSWMILDIIIGLIMWTIAYGLIKFVLVSL